MGCMGLPLDKVTTITFFYNCDIEYDENNAATNLYKEQCEKEHQREEEGLQTNYNSDMAVTTTQPTLKRRIIQM